MPTAIIESDSPRGPVFQFGSQAFLSANDMPGFGGDPLRNGMRRLAAQHRMVAENYKEERQAEILFDMEGVAMAATARAAIDVARDEARTAMAADATFRAPVLTVDPAIIAFLWTRYGSLDRAAAAKAIEAADLETLTALTAHGNKAALDPVVYERAVERFKVLNWVERQKLAAKHPLTPSADRILATGPDMAAAEAEARADLATHAERLDRVQAAEASARDLVRLLAAVFSLRPDVMLNRILGQA
jgi:hypothetical protein